ncbi:cytochrome-c peroxidase [Pseudoalteromonas luteoviolacea]|uniref:cytochrome-c peroxidase n=1 Tax=Pseudoalteromonas luteoviolacea TaxID=43657 RepID=UPI0011547093|nr:cytochrome c peroxidase [Pseudoalteromonas luteoviolacea]TQF66646.1 c-type cytochrome [Pseudoalteromonas luteoviolacea]
MSTRYVLMITVLLICISLVLVVQFHSVEEKYRWKQNTQRSVIKMRFLERAVDAPIQPLPKVMEYDFAWAKLGKALFKSPLLSADNSTSCASCHDLYNGGDDGFPVSVGIKQQLGERNSPTVINAVFNFRQFWDGRSSDLIEQTPQPIHNPLEMGTNWEQIIDKLSSQPGFVSSFNALSDDGITAQNIIKAIVAFEESLVSENTPIDAFLLGDQSALSPQQQRGYEKFVSFGCVTCHQGRNIGGNLYQKIGRLDRVPVSLQDDLGRYELTQNEQDKFVFKVPSLRNVAQTAPYFHNGSVDELADAIRIMAQGQLGLELSDEDVADIEALLHAFSGELPRSLTE